MSGLTTEEREMYGWEVEGQWVTSESGVLALIAAREAKAHAEVTAAVEEVLARAVYEFLVVEGYHGHYPSAEEQAEKFAAQYAVVIREAAGGDHD